MRLPCLIIFYLPLYVFNVPAEIFFKFIILSVFATSGISIYVTARHFFLKKKYHADGKTAFCVACALYVSCGRKKFKKVN